MYLDKERAVILGGLPDEKVRISPCKRVHVEELGIGETLSISIVVDAATWYCLHLVGDGLGMRDRHYALGQYLTELAL